MSAQIIDGIAVAAAIKSQVSTDIKARIDEGLAAPGLDVILVGENPASATYVKHKQNACKAVGIISNCHRLPATATQDDIAELINQCNLDPKVNGILLQLPLPDHINSDELLELIHPDKDVDGFHPYNLGRLVQRRPRLRPCTPKGVITLLESTGKDIAGMDAVVVGASNIVGRPMGLELLLAKATPTVCHRFTKDLQSHIEKADILISATGVHGIIKSQWIKPGAIVIDIGFSRLSNGRLTGDIDYPTAVERAGWITPVPGGVGPMTVATLLQNTVMAAKLQDNNT
jgi:methylenetetrahydrofolate dehydrogenase (NADP+)/methenyltetrahydrofolate cyclohydrolase